MQRINSFIFAILSCALAMAQTVYWSVSPYDYKNSMSVYAVVDGFVASDYANYEVAAFIGNECRGVLEYNSDYNYGYIRVYSNRDVAEQVSFRLYDKRSKRIIISESITAFTPDGKLGYPSSPKTIKVSALVGDVSRDGYVDIVDIAKLISILNGNTDSESKADVNNDGKVDTNDLSKLIDIVIKRL